MKKILIAFLLVICTFSLIGCDKKENSKNDENQTSIGYVEKETVDSLVEKFNAKTFDDSGLGPADKESLTIDNGKYWYILDEGIYLVVIPVAEQKDVNEDIVHSMRIYYEADKKDDTQIPAFTRLLIMANNEEITYEEADELIKKSLELSSDNLTSNNGKGISVGYAESTDHYEFQVIRNYKE